MRYNSETKDVTMTAEQASVLLIALKAVHDPYATEVLLRGAAAVLYARNEGIAEYSDRVLSLSLDEQANVMASFERELSEVLHGHALKALEKLGEL